MTLNTREKIWLGMGGLVVVLSLVYHLVLLPVQDHHHSLERRLGVKTKELSQLRGLTAQLKQLKGETQRQAAKLDQREENFTLFAFLEKLAVASRVSTHIDYMRPSTLKGDQGNFSLVKIKLKGINMAQLYTYLRGIETSKNQVMVDRLSISKSQGRLSVIIQAKSPNTRGVK
ncbi:MAG: type II secretion system protein M [Desulfovibrionales bacterium]|nr:type II secretion system protein M [Desulfovibrionales bacterium]